MYNNILETMLYISQFNIKKDTKKIYFLTTFSATNALKQFLTSNTHFILQVILFMIVDFQVAHLK